MLAFINPTKDCVMTADKKESPFPNAKKSAVYSFTPYELAIAGGADALPENERGPLDTPTDKESPLYDERLKTVKLTKEWISNVKLGVHVPIEIVKLEGIPFVVDGRTRVRGARAAMTEAGKDATPIVIKAVLVELDNVETLKRMVSLNLHFEDTPTVKIAKLQRLIALGVTPADAAIAFGTREATVKTWLQYDKTAIKAVKDAVSKNKIPHTVGMQIARLDEDKQQKALDNVLKTAVTSDGSRSERKGQAAAANRAIAEAEGKHAGVSDKKTLKKLLTLIGGQTDKTTKPETKAWWSGVECAFAFVLGGEEPDERLVKLLKTALEPVKAEEKPAKAATGKLGAAIDKVAKKAAAKKAGKALTPATATDAPPVTDDEE